MRSPALPLALALALLAALPGLASANLDHPPCGESTFSVGNSVRVEVWANNQCAGSVVWLPNAVCVFNIHVHRFGTHTQVLDGEGCQTGELVELP